MSSVPRFAQLTIVLCVGLEPHGLFATPFDMFGDVLTVHFSFRQSCSCILCCY